MATLVLTDCVALVDKTDLTGYSNKLTVEAMAQVNDVSVFGSDWRTKKACVKESTWSLGGFIDYPTPDAELYALLGGANVPCSFVADSADGAVAYAAAGLLSGFQPIGGPFGGVIEFTAAGQVDGGIGRGFLLLPKQTVAGTTTGTGQVFTGGFAATETLGVAIHCMSAGTTATVIVESDDNAGFTSATTRSSTVVTAAGGTWVTVAGPITDTYFRVRVASVTGSFSLAVTAVRY